MKVGSKIRVIKGELLGMTGEVRAISRASGGLLVHLDGWDAPCLFYDHEVSEVARPLRFRVVEFRDADGEVGWIIKCQPQELLSVQRVYRVQTQAAEAAAIYNEIERRTAEGLKTGEAQ